MEVEVAMRITAVIAAWLCLGLIGSGFMNAALDDGYWTDKYRPRCEENAAEDQSFTVFLSIGGPLTLIASLAVTGAGYKGWSLYRHECRGWKN